MCDRRSGFQVRYLGSVSFTRKRRRPLKGMSSLQRPLLDLYTGARRRGETQRSAHPLAPTQQLEVCEYGLLVVAEDVLTKVIAPLTNVVLWAAVRFHARIVRKGVFGAAFVPLACSDGALDPKSYTCLASKQRFLVSLSHPSLFACVYRSVAAPATFECHAFACATAEDALEVAKAAGGHLGRAPPDLCTPTEHIERESVVTDTEEESNSYASVMEKGSPVGRRRPPPHRPRKRFLRHQEARALIGKPPGESHPGRKHHSQDRAGAGFRNCSTMTEELAETIDLSSESSVKSSSVGGDWRPVLPKATPLLKYTYFGYETYARSHPRDTQQQHDKGDMGADTRGGVIQGGDRVSISVPYRPPSGIVGVRSFQRSGHVRNWSSLSRTSSSSSTLPPGAVRGSSPARPPAGFFCSLKRMGMQSLTKARHRTGRFISSMRTRIMGPKRTSADGSEDSAYDTSEVCLSPSGRPMSSPPARLPAAKNSGARRQQSWSFHDLRTAAVERPTVRRHPNRRKHRRRRMPGCSSSSSDSGVDHSDHSTRKSVTRVEVRHGMGADTFQRWSHTNLHHELGYIP